jgi:hypothetical protein
MTHRHLIADDVLERVKKQDCCLGRYRVLLSGGYYCFLEKIFNCVYQDRKYIRNINAYMSVCTTGQQFPWEQCDVYAKLETIVVGNK